MEDRLKCQISSVVKYRQKTEKITNTNTYIVQT